MVAHEPEQARQVAPLMPIMMPIGLGWRHGLTLDGSPDQCPPRHCAPPLELFAEPHFYPRFRLGAGAWPTGRPVFSRRFAGCPPQPLGRASRRACSRRPLAAASPERDPTQRSCTLRLGLDGLRPGGDGRSERGGGYQSEPATAGFTRLALAKPSSRPVRVKFPSRFRVTRLRPRQAPCHPGGECAISSPM
jgi:hypothetical protein